MEVTAKALTEAAGKLTKALSEFDYKLENQLKMSPVVVNHADCQIPVPPMASNSPRGQHYAKPSSPHYGFQSSDITSSAAPDGLLHYLMTRDPDTGEGCSRGAGKHQHCNEKIPAPPPGSHVHHVYVDNMECPEADYVYKQAGGARGNFSSSSSSCEEEIRVRERKDTVVTVGKKRSNKGKPSGSNPKSMRRN